MAAGDTNDVVRSLRRYVWLMLAGGGADDQKWRVRLQRTRVTDDERPVAVIEEAGPLTTPHARAAVNQGDVQKALTFAVVCYPVLEASAPTSAGEARRVAGLLDAGFSRGLVTTDDPPVDIGGPWRLPVYDFAGVPLTGAERQGPDRPYMHANVGEAFNVRPLQDALDELRYTVVASVPVTWWAAGRIPPARPLVADMPGTYQEWDS